MKVGVAFSRLLTRALRDTCRMSLQLPSLQLNAYTPMSMAALHMCVNRAKEIAAFKSSPFWEIYANVPIKPAEPPAAAEPSKRKKPPRKSKKEAQVEAEPSTSATVDSTPCQEPELELEPEPMLAPDR